jgi:hypothetical protein
VNRSMARWLAVSVAVAVLALAGCGGRSPFWTSPLQQNPAAFNLLDRVAVLDVNADRVLLLTPGADQSLATTTVPVGVNILNAVASADGKKLYVVSGGHRARIGDDQPNESPSITVIGPGAATARYVLSNLTDPLGGLAVDPAGRWVVLYPSTGTAQSFVENPNELVVVDVSQPPGTTAPMAHTLMSFGGHPQRFTFTPSLMLPGIGAHPLLIVESDQGLSLLRLDDPASPPEITVPLTNGADTTLLTPAGVTVFAGDATAGPAIGVRLANDSDVVALQFVANLDSAGQPIGNGFLPTINLTDVGGIPSDLAFVHTDSGLRLAALVPSRAKATLIDPVTSLTQDVSLPAPYQNLSVVTGSIGPSGCDGATAATSDIALLWNGSTTAGKEGVAFWELGQTGCQPYRSIQTIGITDVIAAVMDVPAPNATLKVLATRNATTFYVLNLANRTAAPLVTYYPEVGLSISPLGEQVWTFAPGSPAVFATDFAHEVPRSLVIERPVGAVFEVSRGAGMDPAVIVLHDEGALGATVYDAATLDDATRRLYSGLFLEAAP